MAIDNTIMRRALAIAAVAGIGPLLGGCYTDRDATGSTYPYQFRERHPIELANAPRTLDVFVEGNGGFATRERQDVADYMAEYRTYGTGGIVAQVPVGVENAEATRRALARIRGAASGPLSVASYQPADPKLASPIRLTFRRLQARVATTCGLWPQDLGVSDLSANIENQQYWNHGCAYQSNFASQIADPLDLVRPRRESPPDTQKRSQAIDKVRSGQDPSTTYKQDGQNKINQGVGN